MYTSDKLIPSGKGDAYLADDPNSVRLEHSCGEWEIGGPDEVRELMVDLQSLLARMDPPAFSAIWKEVANDATVDMLERDLCQCVTCIDKAQLINRIRRDSEELKQLRDSVAASDDRTALALRELERRLTDSLENAAAEVIHEAKERHL